MSGIEHEPSRFWIIDNPLRGEPSLPEPASARDGEGPYVLPVVDEEYGGVIAWANTTEQAERIVAALALAESRPADTIVLSREDAAAFMAAVADLEQEELRALEGSSYSMDYTELAGAVRNLSRIAALIGGQVDAQ